ncbi:MAG: hypothetical protein K2G90_05100 [Muribaculaceae bacterium]|nr:hypothetical protein [Muribaculaceae bacterium]
MVDNALYSIMRERLRHTPMSFHRYLYSSIPLDARLLGKLSVSRTADFKIGGFTFEIGGKNKGQKQIANTPDSFIVKDDIEYGSNNIIPLYHFGLTY